MENYERIRLVGRGAHGTVYLCNQKADKKLVILKEIPVDQMSVDERQASMNEAKVLAMLDHPNVVAYYDSFLEDKTMIIVMEYVQGGTLIDFLNERNGELLSEKEVLHYFGQMVYTLQHVHAKLILHRDLKSQNILLNENKNIVKIGDFGISKVLSSKSKAFTVVGTPCYISPELCEGKPYNQKSDIWALGCLLYELMTLKRPFDATTLPALIMKIMKGSFDPVPEIYSIELKTLLMNMLHLDPSQRPSAAQLMCNPILIKVIFKLYLDIGSIPLYNRSNEYSLASNLKNPDEQKLSMSSYSPHSHLERKLSCSPKVYPNIWCFENIFLKLYLLPHLPDDVIKLVHLGLNHKIGITQNGFLMSWRIYPKVTVSENLKSPETIIPPSHVAYIIDDRIAINIVSVVCGQDFTICLSGNGVVYSFGNFSSGCLGYVTEKDIEQPRIVETLFNYNIIAIACGPQHVLAISDEKDIFAWGYGKQGCLGFPTNDLQVIPETVQVSNEKKPAKIFCGVNCSFLILSDQSLMACGSNRHNKLALDSGEGHQIDKIDQFTSVSSEPLTALKIASLRSGRSHSAFLTEDGLVYTVGSNCHYQLGWGTSRVDYSMPQKVEELDGIKINHLECADSFTLAVSEDNLLFAWGNCPQSLQKECDSNFNMERPNAFKKFLVDSVSCYSENCVIIGENRQ